MEIKKIAVVGVGAIGGLLGAYLTRGGYDVTILSCFRRENADYMAANGITVDGARGQFHVDVNSRHIDDLAEGELFDCFMVALKGNDTESVMTRLRPHLAADGCCLTFQNGMNEDLLAGILGKERIVYAVSRAGGALTAPGHVSDHDGEFVIGEEDGSVFPRTEQLRDILSCARPTTISGDILAVKWDKLSAVALSVPACTVSGLYLGDVFFHEKAQQLFGLLAMELFRVAAGSGHPLERIFDRTPEQWLPIAAGRENGALDPAAAAVHFPPGVVDAYTQDIRRGRPLEIDYTNGAVVRIGAACGVPTPVNRRLIQAVRDIESGAAQPGEELLEALIRQSAGDLTV